MNLYEKGVHCVYIYNNIYIYIYIYVYVQSYIRYSVDITCILL